jgi:alpha-beta hydrolase superfamily lysophospholipase
MSEYLKVRDDVELYYKKNIPDEARGIIILNHGFAEHLDRYDYVTEKLVEANYGVYRYDLRGHGRTKGESGHINSYVDFIEDCNEMVDLAKKEYKDLPLFMLGHSMGGFITCLYGLIYPNKLKGQIFSGAAVKILPPARGIKGYLFEFANLFAPKLKVGNKLSNDICSVEEVVKDYEKDQLILKEATLNFYVQFLVKGSRFIKKNITNYKYPCFITQGEKDNIVPKDTAVYLYNNISSTDKEIKIYDNLYHEILNENEKDEIIQDMVEWLDKRVND